MKEKKRIKERPKRFWGVISKKHNEEVREKGKRSEEGRVRGGGCGGGGKERIYGKL